MKRLVLVLPFLLMGAAACPPPKPTPTPGPPTPPVVEPTPVPTPAPTPGDGCGLPAPPPAYEIMVQVHQAFCANLDSTLKVKDPVYCAQIGFSDGRSICPVRMEGAPDRVACEARIRGPRQLWTCEGCKVYPCDVPGNCECAGTVNSNPAQAIFVGAGKVKTCTFDGRICGEVTVP